MLSSINFNPNTYKDESPTRSVFPDNCGWWGDNPKKDFTCEHRWPEIRNMVMWRKVAGLSGTPVFDIYNNKLLAITRGDNDQGRAFMIVNSHSDYFEQDVYTKMPAGQYCNIVAQVSLDCMCGFDLLCTVHGRPVTRGLALQRLPAVRCLPRASMTARRRRQLSKPI